MTAKPLARRRERRRSFRAEMLARAGPEGATAVGWRFSARPAAGGRAQKRGRDGRTPAGRQRTELTAVRQPEPVGVEPLWRPMAERMEWVFSPAVAWIVDDTGFPKKGEHSVGGARQYSGTRGKTAHCQIALSRHGRDGRGRSPLGFRLYLPQEWTEEAERCRAAGVPAGNAFQPNWRLALELIDKALAGGREKPPAVLADSAYGEGTAFREELEQRGLADALGISKALAVWPEPPGGAMPAWNRRGRPTRCVRYGDQNPGSVKALALVPEKRFRKVTWREGSPGKRAARCWATRVPTAHDWITARRPAKRGGSGGSGRRVRASR
jgi:SRSO17 transposase